MDKLKCAIFDFDDTILYSEEMKNKEFYNISNQYSKVGSKFYQENIEKGLTRFEYFNNLSKLVIKNTLLNEEQNLLLYNVMLKKFSDNVSNNLKNCELINNIENFLKLLKEKNFKIFISSKSNREDIVNTLEYKSLLNYFDAIYGNEKNKIEHFEKIMKDNNLNYQEICFFGDSHSDYEVAEHFNCDFIGILTKRDDLKNVDCTKIKDYSEVINLF